MISKMLSVILICLQISTILSQISFPGQQPREQKSDHSFQRRQRPIYQPTWRTRKDSPPILSTRVDDDIQREHEKNAPNVGFRRPARDDNVYFQNEIEDDIQWNVASALPGFSTEAPSAPTRQSGNRKRPALYNHTKECVEHNLCDTSRRYPTQKINRAISRSNQVTQQLIRSLAADKEVDNSQPEIIVRSNFFDEVVEANICNTEKRRITPRGALNTDGKFMWILNKPDGNENYVQVVETTVCKDAGSACLDGRINESTRCKQEYTEHKLLALDQEGEELIIDTFRFPSCCTCQVNKLFKL